MNNKTRWTHRNKECWESVPLPPKVGVWTIRENHLGKLMLFESGIQVRQPSEAEKKFWEQIQDLKSQVAHWTANHDEQVKVKRALLDRPDLKDRARAVLKLEEQIKTLKSEIEFLKTS